MTLTFDQAAYRNLLAEVAPKVIETERSTIAPWQWQSS
jgi:hypothetical protein